MKNTSKKAAEKMMDWFRSLFGEIGSTMSDFHLSRQSILKIQLATRQTEGRNHHETPQNNPTNT